MKRLFCFALLIIVLVSGCRPQAPPPELSEQNNSTNTAADYVNAFKESGLPVDSIIIYDESTDPNNLLGRPGEYTSKCNFADTRVGQMPYQGDIPKGTVEVFETIEDATKRKVYVEAVQDAVSMLKDYLFVSPDGLALLRVDYDLTPSQASDYKDVMNALCNGSAIPSFSIEAPVSSAPVSTPSPTHAPVPTPIPTPVPTPASSDFLSDKDRAQQAMSYIDAFDYAGLVAMIDEFLENNEHSETDNAIKIREIVEPGVQLLKSCVIKRDDFYGTSVVYYKGVEAISSKISFVPKIEDSVSNYMSSWLNFDIGFKKSNWLFFENVSIKVGDDKYINDYFSYSDVVREVSRGISEIAESSFSKDDAYILSDAARSDYKIIMRFENDEGKNWDHTMTKAEKSAIVTICQLCEITHNLYEYYQKAAEAV